MPCITYTLPGTGSSAHGEINMAGSGSLTRSDRETTVKMTIEAYKNAQPGNAGQALSFLSVGSKENIDHEGLPDLVYTR